MEATLTMEWLQMKKRRSERVAWKALEPSNIKVKALLSRGTRAQCYKTSLEGKSGKSRFAPKN